MKKLSVLCIALCVGLSTTAAFARGGRGGAHGMGSSHMSMMGGAFGTTGPWCCRDQSQRKTL
jgi:hypothetical protein